MSLYVLSAKPVFVEIVKAALKTARIEAFANTTDLLNHLLSSTRLKSELILIELDTIPDACHFIEFAKGSPMSASLQIVAVGTEDQLLALEAGLNAVVDGTLRAPCSASEIALVAARLREKKET